ncbi:MAG: hypothetical protein GY833_16405 [Aestuariibacter sp.]|nr:hypothetical protein [Aestuariibacter sp.]
MNAKEFHKMTIEEQGEVLAETERNQAIAERNEEAFRAGGGKGSGQHRTLPDKPRNYEPKYFVSGSPDNSMGGASGALHGRLPEKKGKFTSELIQDMYEFSREVGFEWTTLDQLKLECGYDAYCAIPAELKKQATLSTRKNSHDFMITK